MEGDIPVRRYGPDLPAFLKLWEFIDLSEAVVREPSVPLQGYLSMIGMIDSRLRGNDKLLAGQNKIGAACSYFLDSPYYANRKGIQIFAGSTTQLST